MPFLEQFSFSAGADYYASMMTLLVDSKVKKRHLIVIVCFLIRDIIIGEHFRLGIVFFRGSEPHQWQEQWKPCIEAAGLGEEAMSSYTIYWMDVLGEWALFDVVDFYILCYSNNVLISVLL